MGDVMLDHTSLNVADYEASKKWYSATLAPLGIEIIMEFPKSITGHVDTAGYGWNGKPFFWLVSGGKTTPHIHLAFRAQNRAQVKAFYDAAIAAGGRDNGGPGLRELYHPNYYAAFVLDLDGNNIEAVSHGPD